MYVCPAEQKLSFRTWRADRYGKRMKIYRTEHGVCDVCRFRSMCTKSSSRIVQRWTSEEIIEGLRSISKTPEALKIMGRRKELTEHPFGTIKRAFNQGYLLLKGLRKVNGEVGLTMLSYNLRRAIDVLGAKNLVVQIRKT